MAISPVLHQSHLFYGKRHFMCFSQEKDLCQTSDMAIRFTQDWTRDIAELFPRFTLMAIFPLSYQNDMFFGEGHFSCFSQDMYLCETSGMAIKFIQVWIRDIPELFPRFTLKAIFPVLYQNDMFYGEGHFSCFSQEMYLCETSDMFSRVFPSYSQESPSWPYPQYYTRVRCSLCNWKY